MGKRAGTQESIAKQIQKVNASINKIDTNMDIDDMRLDLLLARAALAAQRRLARHGYVALRAAGWRSTRLSAIVVSWAQAVLLFVLPDHYWRRAPRGFVMLDFTQHVLPFLGAAIGTYMLFRMAFVERKLRTNPLVILAGMAVEAVSIGVGVYATITNPDTTQAIFGWTGVSILLGLLGPALVTRLEGVLKPRDESA